MKSYKLLSKLLLLMLSHLSVLVVANVEKVIFTGPVPTRKPMSETLLSHIDIAALAPRGPSIRSNLSRVFPSNGSKGHASWILLHGLDDGQRYEVRVCWAAIEATSFEFDIYELDDVWQSQELVHSLTQYALPGTTASNATSNYQEPTSALLLRVQAAADYFTHNAELMMHPPPALVDFILDPLLLGVFPSSLVPTAGYLILVAFVTWFVARGVASVLLSIATPVERQSKKQD